MEERRNERDGKSGNRGACTAVVVWKEKGRDDGYINRTVRTCPVEFKEFTPASNNVPPRHVSLVTDQPVRWLRHDRVLVTYHAPERLINDLSYIKIKTIYI